MELFFAALLSGLLTGLVAAGVTLAIERLGGQLGGVIGSSPTTVVVVSLSFATRMTGMDLKAAMFAVAPAMLNNAAFLGTWLFLPRKLPASWSTGRKVAALVGASLVVWFLGALTIVSLNRNKDERNIDNIVLWGYVCMALQAAIGLAACFTPLPAPKGTNKVGIATLVARGAAAAAAVFASVLVSAVDDFAAGVASCFPAIFMTSMVSLWLAQGSGVPSGAIGPLILGSVSVPFYSIVYALIVTRPGERDGAEPAPPAGWNDDRHAVYPPLAALITWALSVVCICIPVSLFLRWRRQQSQPQAPAADAAAATAGAADGAAPAAGAVKLHDGDSDTVPAGAVAMEGGIADLRALHKQDSTDAIVGFVGAGAFSAAAAHAGHHHPEHAAQAASFSAGAGKLNSTVFHSVPLVPSAAAPAQAPAHTGKTPRQAPMQAVSAPAVAAPEAPFAASSQRYGFEAEPAVDSEAGDGYGYGYGAGAAAEPEVIAVAGAGMSSPLPLPSAAPAAGYGSSAPSAAEMPSDAGVASSAGAWGAHVADAVSPAAAAGAAADPWGSHGGASADPWGEPVATR